MTEQRKLPPPRLCERGLCSLAPADDTARRVARAAASPWTFIVPLEKTHDMRMSQDHPTIRPQWNIFVLIVTAQRALCGSSMKWNIF